MKMWHVYENQLVLLTFLFLSKLDITKICELSLTSCFFLRCFSIPVTLRSVLKRVQGEIGELVAPEPVTIPYSKLSWTYSPVPRYQPVKVLPEPVSTMSHVSPVSHTTITNSVSPIPGNGMATAILPNPPPYPGMGMGDTWLSPQSSQSNQQQLDMQKFGVVGLGGGFNRSFTSEPLQQRATSTPPVTMMPAPPEPVPPPEQRPAANPLLATLLDAGSPSVESQPQQSTNIVNESPMLSKLLEDNTSVAVNPFPAPNQRKRLTKRKSSKDMMAGKSPKHRLSDSDFSERSSDRVNSERHGQGMGEKHIDLDSSAGSYDEPVRPSSVSSVGSLGGQSTGSMIDLTDTIGESHVKKLENSLDSIMGKESTHTSAFLGMNSQLTDSFDLNLAFPDYNQHHNQNLGNLGPSMLPDPGGDFQTPPSLQWPQRQTPPTPTSRNSPHHGAVSKNEKTSTSHEELLQGPRGRENDGPPNSLHVRRTPQQQRRHNFKRQNSTGRNSVESSSGGISPNLDVFSPLITSPSHNILASPTQLQLSSPFSSVSPSSLTMISPSHPSNSISPGLLSLGKLDTINHDSKSGIFGSHMASTTTVTMSQSKSAVGHVTSAGKPSLSLLKAQLEKMENNVKFNSAISQERECVSVSVKDELSNASSASSNNSQLPVMKLKLTTMRQFENVSPSDGEDGKSRSSTFDFHSDEEDDFVLPKVDHMTVVSASPTRLQITNKSTLASFNKYNKNEKFKRKRELKERELIQTFSVDSGKRKRDKEEGKKDKKKQKKVYSYSLDKDSTMYKTTTVDVDGGNENDHVKRMPKLKIIKSGDKISVENSVLQSKVIKSVDKNNEKIQVKSSVKDEKPVIKLEKEAVVKIEKVEKAMSKMNNVTEMKSEKKREKSSATTEGIFERINAMKTEGLKNEDSNSSIDKKLDKEVSSVSQKKVKKLHKRSSSAVAKDLKISKNPTIKLAPIKLPTTSSSITIQRNPSTPSTPLTPKSITQSPTSTTIGKIGAVSLATSGSQKQLTNPAGKTPTGSGTTGKSSLSSRSLSTGGGASTLAAKLNSNLQKNIQIQGPSGKNSPVPTSKSGHSRSSSTSALNASSGGSKSDKNLSKSLSSNSRTSSPSIEKDKSKSSSGSSRSSSSSGRDREKSTSANKASVPTTTVNTQDLLSFLNPKEISNFTIPKLQKASTPTSANSPTIVSTCASTTVTTTTTNTSVKFSKGSTQPVTQVSKGTNSGNSNTNSAKTSASGNSGNANVKNNSYNKASGNFQGNSNNQRPTNLSMSNAVNSNRQGGNNSPNSFSQKGGNNAYSKGNSGNQGSGFRNFNNANTLHSKTSNTSNSSAHQNWNNNSSGTVNKSSSNHSTNHANQTTTNSYRGNSGGNSSANFNGNSKPGNSDITNSGNRQVSSGSNVTNTNINKDKGTHTAPNGPKGPGPPGNTVPLENKKQGSGGQAQAQAAVRGRKGSLSAVIDKLTCKISGPTVGSVSGNPSNNSSPSGNTLTKGSSLSQKSEVIVNESPASPEMDVSIPEPVKQENKVVINEAPASPEPETSSPASLQSNRLSSVSEIVSIPLENKPCQSTVNSDFYNNRTSGKVGVLTSYVATPFRTSPKTIPLNSPPKEKQRPKTPNSDSNSSKNVANSSTKTLTSVTPVSQQNGDIGGNHVTKHSEYHNTDLVNASRAKDNNLTTFRVPPSKRQDSVDKAVEDLESSIVNCKHKLKLDSNSKHFSESSSPPSSPENGLIIDFSPSSLNHQSKTSSPTPRRSSSSDNIAENHLSPFSNCTNKSPSIKSTATPASKLRASPTCAIQASMALVPSPGRDALNSAGSNPGSPMDDDLDLMDEALGLGN